MITRELVDSINEEKDNILASLAQLEHLLQQSDCGVSKTRFNAYVVGAVKDAMLDNGMYNVCVERIANELETHIEDDNEFED